jgi:hypothetical protein
MLTVRQAYQAMYRFLEEYYRLTHADEIGAMLGGLSLLPDGVPADPGFRQDWLTAVQKVLSADKGGRFTGADLRLSKE